VLTAPVDAITIAEFAYGSNGEDISILFHSFPLYFLYYFLSVDSIASE
jgi:hypothetical protein